MLQKRLFIILFPAVPERLMAFSGPIAPDPAPALRADYQRLGSQQAPEPLIRSQFSIMLPIYKHLNKA
jgi:hypothetical protein